VTWHQFLALAAMGMIGIFAGLFLIAQFHGWKMMANRSGDWRAYALPWGFLIDAALTEEGRKHRRKFLIFLTASAPFALGTVMLFQFLGIR
jgi:hypothetical protein